MYSRGDLLLVVGYPISDEVYIFRYRRHVEVIPGEALLFSRIMKV